MVEKEASQETAVGEVVREKRKEISIWRLLPTMNLRNLSIGKAQSWEEDDTERKGKEACTCCLSV